VFFFLLSPALGGGCGSCGGTHWAPPQASRNLTLLSQEQKLKLATEAEL
jgi:hypothetical protein